jgi:methionine sulfoxide reductase heme-binding subunit
MRLFRAATYTASLALLALWAGWMRPDFTFFPSLEAWSMMLGYLAFVLIGLTLLVGPIKLWLPPRFVPYCLLLRRDLGILAGAAGFLHVALVLYLFERGPELMFPQRELQADGWLGLFFLHDGSGAGTLYPNLTVTGAANYLGLTAFFVLLSLWLTSSRRAEQLLGGAGWKRLHLNAPLLYVLVLFHGIIHVESIKVEPHTLGDLLGWAALVWLLRSISFVRTALRRRP